MKSAKWGGRAKSAGNRRDRSPAFVLGGRSSPMGNTPVWRASNGQRWKQPVSGCPQPSPIATTSGTAVARTLWLSPARAWNRKWPVSVVTTPTCSMNRSIAGETMRLAGVAARSIQIHAVRHSEPGTFDALIVGSRPKLPDPRVRQTDSSKEDEMRSRIFVGAFLLVGVLAAGAVATSGGRA